MSLLNRGLNLLKRKPQPTQPTAPPRPIILETSKPAQRSRKRPDDAKTALAATIANLATPSSLSSPARRRGWFGRTFAEPIERWFDRTFVEPLRRCYRAICAFFAWLATMFYRVILFAIVAVVGVFALLFGAAWWFPPSTIGNSSSAVSAPRIVDPVSHPVETTRPAKQGHNSTGAHKESLREKVYEAISGKEVVHKKDGSTYERKQPRK